MAPDPRTGSRTPSVTRRTSNLSTLLRQQAARRRDQTALIRGDVVWTWGELDDRADALAAALTDAGVGSGDVVMLHAPNSRDYLSVMFATWRVGGIVTPTNAKLTAEELVQLAEIVRPALLIVGAGAEDHAAALDATPSWAISDAPGSGATPM